MMLPIFIRSELEFQSAVQLGSTPESLVLEFKAKVNGWNAPAKTPKREAQKETCRDIAQFANTLGGCLLVGVNERPDPARGVNVADSIAPVQVVNKLRQWIEQAIVNYLVPTTFTHDIVAIGLPQGNILAVNVPASRHLVSLWDRDNHTVEHVRRTSHGKEWMNPDEAERHLMDGSRAAKLALIAAIEHSTPASRIKLAGGLWQEYAGSPGRPQQGNPPGPITFGQMGEYWFELRMQHKQKTCSVTIPYGLIKEAWVDISGTVILLLAVRMIMRHDELTLEPYV
jgi:hypothetical protein